MSRPPQTRRFTRLANTIALLAAVPVVVTAAEWQLRPGARSHVVELGTGGAVGFSVMRPEATGLAFTNPIPPSRHYTNQILLNGSGVAAGDIDGDGWCDVFFAGLGGSSALFRNEGNWKFRNVTADVGLSFVAKLDATGTAFADVDGDADLDLIVNSVGQGTHLFLNDGRGKFAAPATDAVLNRGSCGTSLALADVDGDGALDLYVANYRTSTIRDLPGARFTISTIDGKPVPTAFGGRPLTAPDLTNRFAFRFKAGAGGGGQVFHDEIGEADVFYRNAGGGRFVAVPFNSGTFRDDEGQPLAGPPYEWGLSVILRDFNGDGAPDLYVCNDFSTPDRFWINDGRGTFRAAPAHALRQTSLSTMAIDVADVNRDGFDDFFTADMLSREHWRRLVQKNEPNPNIHLFADVASRPQSPRNMLQLGRGDGTFAEAAHRAGLEGAEWAWASIFLDVDLDGFEDLLVANGFERDYMNMDANRRVNETRMRGGRNMTPADQLGLNRLYPRLNTANLALRNLGDLRFADVSAAWGFDVRAVSQGMCLADLDNDGDLDVLINNSNDPASLLRNNTAAPRVAIRLKGKAPNTRGIGARIRVIGGAVPSQSQEMINGGRYLSSDDAMRVFAADSATNRLTIEVTWRSGARSTVANALPNRIYEIDEAAAVPSPRQVPPAGQPLFEDVSSRVAHVHAAESFDDFARQPMLPNRLSALGPGVSWFDLDGDGWDDLVLPGSKGAKLTLLLNDRKGGFNPLSDSALEQSLARSQTALLGHHAADGRVALLAGSSNYEDGSSNGPVARRYELENKSGAIPRFNVDDSLPGSAASTGPLAMADLDGDGQLELFVGGRCMPGRWPEVAPSMLLRQANGRWSIDTNNTAPLATMGLVSGAVFTDLDGDGDGELVLACEWGSLRVFRNDAGTLTDGTKAFGLEKFTGWWNGVTAGDFDGDGRMDLIASNWGRNTKFEHARSKPLRLYFGDFNGDGGVGLIESEFDSALGKYVPIYNVWTHSRTMPWLLDRFPNFETFSRASVEEALGERVRAAKVLEASWLESTVFLNRGGRFEARPLPIEAQLAPAFGVCVADFDGDGAEDAFLSQNFFATRPETSRLDAGRGLLLRGDGKGGFTPTSGMASGIAIYGEQRGAAASDFDGDGRADLVVAQHGAETKLYRNAAARPGLRVRLAGPLGNPTGVGATLQLKFGERLGPVREIRAGSGYWSQDSAVQVLAAPAAPTELFVRWPGGKPTSSPVPAGAKEVAVDRNGAVRVIR